MLTAPSSSSAAIDTLVSDVAVLLLLVLVNLLKLPVSPELVEFVLADEREAIVLVLLCELIVPPKMSPLDEPGRAPNRFRHLLHARRESRALDSSENSLNDSAEWAYQN